MVKVSIIVPVYNVELYLAKCLESLTNQTLKDIEIICINDGSEDNSALILENYAKKDCRIKVKNKKNEGVAIARNTGIDDACGEYLGFVDSDDWVDLNFFEKLYTEAVNSNADIAAAGMIKVSKKHKVILKFEQKTITNNTDEKFTICDIPDMCYTCNKIYKTSKIREIGLYFKKNILYEDIIFTPEAVHKLGTLVTVPDTYYFYYKRRGSITNTRKNKDSHSTAVKAAKKYFKENNINSELHTTKIKRFKIFGQTIFKIKSKGQAKTAILFNFIKWKIKNK